MAHFIVDVRFYLCWLTIFLQPTHFDTVCLVVLTFVITHDFYCLLYVSVCVHNTISFRYVMNDIQ